MTYKATTLRLLAIAFGLIGMISTISVSQINGLTHCPPTFGSGGLPANGGGTGGGGTVTSGPSCNLGLVQGLYN